MVAAEMKKFFDWILKNKFEFAILVLILATAAFLRLWRISDYMTFLGDEGRDVIVVKNLITKGDLIFIGPVTSIGNMYLGPLYYYMIAPFLALWHLNPVGPSVMVALIGTATVFLTYLTGRLFFSKEVGIFASSLYAIAPIPIIYSHSSWNPNPMPFFALLVIICLFLALKKIQPFWLLGVGASLAFVLQMHYLGFLMFPVVLIFWFLLLFRTLKTKKTIKSFFIYSFSSLVIFAVLMSPLLIFDLKPEHKFLNFNSFKTFFFERQATEAHLSTVNLNPFNAKSRILPIYEQLFTRFLVAKEEWYGRLAGIICTFTLAFISYFSIKEKKRRLEACFLIIWLLIGVLGLSLYQQTIFDHYFGFLNPIPFLLIGIFLWILWRRNFLFRGVAVSFFGLLIFINFANFPLKSEPNYQLKKTKFITEEVIKLSEDRPFNFALMAKNNYDDAYEYFLDLQGHKPVVIDNQNLDLTITDQLFVVCEDEICQPLGYPKWEIAGFSKEKGLALIDKEWKFEGIRLFRLIHGKQME